MKTCQHRSVKNHQTRIFPSLSGQTMLACVLQAAKPPRTTAAPLQQQKAQRHILNLRSKTKLRRSRLKNTPQGFALSLSLTLSPSALIAKRSGVGTCGDVLGKRPDSGVCVFGLTVTASKQQQTPPKLKRFYKRFYHWCLEQTRGNFLVYSKFTD